MSPFEVFQKYMALKQHFASDTYDYFKYNGKILNSTPDNFENRKDKYFFEKLSKHHDPQGVLIANLLSDSNLFIGNVDLNKYNEWARITTALSYNFAQDLKNMDPDFDYNFKFRPDNIFPPVIDLYLAGKLNLETLIILVGITRCMHFWDKNIDSDNPVWRSLKKKIGKYAGFVEFDRTKYSKIIVSVFKARQDSCTDDYTDFFHFAT